MTVPAMADSGATFTGDMDRSLELLRAMSPAERLARALALTALVRDLAWQGARSVAGVTDLRLPRFAPSATRGDRRRRLGRQRTAPHARRSADRGAAVRAASAAKRAAPAGLRLLDAFPLRRHPHAPLLARMWALRSHLTAYDAAYVALAEALGAVLITRDTRLGRVSGLHTTVEVLT